VHLKTELTDKVLSEYQKKKELSKKYQRWIYGMSEEFYQMEEETITTKLKVDEIEDFTLIGDFEFRTQKIHAFNQSLYKRSERFANCLDLWKFDVYEQNKIMDLIKVNRCEDRFCPNCRKKRLSILQSKFYPEFFKQIEQGYKPYLLTLTIPNIKDGLNKTLNKMQKAFKRFYECLNRDLPKGWSKRLFKISGAIRTIEITINDRGEYHPHYHVLIMVKGTEDNVFDKNIYLKGYRNHEYNSLADVQISKLWTICYSETFHILDYQADLKGYDWRDSLICDIRPIADNLGLQEVLKYTFKDDDIQEYYQFKEIYFAMLKRRSYQGYGNLYNIVKDESEENYVEIAEVLKIKEEPITEVIKLNNLITLYNEYTKIYRTKSFQEEKNIKD